MYNDTKTIFNKKILIGKSKDRREDKVYIELTIQQEAYTREAETIDHNKITGYYTLSLTGQIWQRNGRDTTQGGQCQDTLENLDIYRELYVTKEDLETIINTWKRWHLNDLKPNCIHQDSFNANIDNLLERAKEETAKCPKGYRYGSKWLVEPLPKEVMAEITSIFNKYE